jgi:hypothetical protein
MTFRIDYPHEDFSGLTRFGGPTLPVENCYLSLFQQDNYRQRVENASKLCIKLKNLRFILCEVFHQYQRFMNIWSSTI